MRAATASVEIKQHQMDLLLTAEVTIDMAKLIAISGMVYFILISFRACCTVRASDS